MKFSEKLLKDAGTNIELRHKKLGKAAMICFPFVIVFGLGAIPLFIFAVKQNRLAILLKTKHQIQRNNRTRFNEMILLAHVNKEEAIKIINRIIEAGNLIGYEIVGEIGVAKKELHATVKDFDVIPQIIVQNQEALRTCPNCGAAVTKENRNYCSFCGTVL